MKVALVQLPKENANKYLKEWFNKYTTNPVVLTSTISQSVVDACPKNIQCYSHYDIHGPHSDVEEEIYKRGFFLKKNLVSQLKTHKVMGVPVVEDFLNATGVPLLRLCEYSAATATLFEKGFTEVVLVLEIISFCFDAYLWDAKACGVETIGDGVWHVNKSNEWSVNDQFYPKQRFKSLDEIASRSKSAETVQEKCVITSKILPQTIKRKLSKTDVLILVTSGSTPYIKNLMPLLKQLEVQNAKYKVICTTPSIKSEIVGYEGIKLDFTELKYNIKKKDKLCKEAESFLLAFQDLVNEFQGDKTNIYGKDTEINLLPYLLKPLFYQNFFKYCENIAKLKKLISNDLPKVVYKVPNGFSTMDAAQRALADLYGVPSVTIMVAPLLYRYRHWGIAPSDYIIVSGTYQLDPLLQGGYVKEQVKVLGQPELDEPLKKWTFDISAEYISAKFPNYSKEKPVILVLTSGVGQESEDLWFNYLTKLLEKYENLQIIFKLHPRMEEAKYLYLQKKELNSRVLVTNDPNTYPYIAASSLICTDLSQAARYAVCFDKTILSVNLTGKKFLHNRLDDFGVADLVTSLEDLKNKIETYYINNFQSDLQKSNRPNFIRRYFASSVGDSSEKIVAFLMSPPKKKKFSKMRDKPLFWLDPSL